MELTTKERRRVRDLYEDDQIRFDCPVGGLVP
jgi:hypothetical protein